MKYNCLYLNINFEVAVFADRLGILVANIDDRSTLKTAISN